MNVNDLKEVLKNKVSSGLVNNHFSLLKKHIVSSELLKQILSLESQFNNLKKENLNGIISYDNSELTRNKIISGLLDIIDTLSEKDMKPSLMDRYSISDINIESLRKKSRIFLLKRQLKSKHGKFTYKREFVKFKKILESYLFECFKKEGIDYKKEKDFLKFNKAKSIDDIFTGYNYSVEGVKLSINFCPRSFSVLVETKQDKEKYKIRAPEMFRLTVNKDEVFVWIEDNPYKPDSGATQYFSEEIVKLIIADIANWLANEKFDKKINLSHSLSYDEVSFFTDKPLSKTTTLTDSIPLKTLRRKRKYS